MKVCAAPLVLLCAAVACAQVHQRPGWEAECISLEGDSTLRGSLRPDIIHGQYEYVSRAQRLARRVEFVADQIERCFDELRGAEREELNRYDKERLEDAIRLSDRLAQAIESCLGRSMSQAAEELRAAENVSVVRWNVRTPFDVELQLLGDVVEWRVRHESNFGEEDLRIFYRVCGKESGAIRVPILKTPGRTIEVGFGRVIGHSAWDRWFRVGSVIPRDEH